MVISSSDSTIVAEAIDTQTAWTIIAALAAIASAVWAFFSNRIAKKALKLAQQEYKDKQSKFSLYLIEGFRWFSRTNEARKFLLFHITIRNQSSVRNSFISELEIEYIRQDNSVARVTVDHNDALLNFIKGYHLSTFDKEIRIDEKGIISKWLIFEQPSDIFMKLRIEKYTIRVIDTQDVSSSLECFILKDLTDEGEKD